MLQHKRNLPQKKYLFCLILCVVSSSSIKSLEKEDEVKQETESNKDIVTDDKSECVKFNVSKVSSSMALSPTCYSRATEWPTNPTVVVLRQLPGVNVSVTV